MPRQGLSAHHPQRYLLMYPGIQAPKYPSTQVPRRSARQRSQAKTKSVGQCTPAISLRLSPLTKKEAPAE